MSSIREDKSRHSGFVRLLGRNVVLWSSVAGLLISWSGLGIPELPRRVLSDIGHTTLPLSLFTIGASLYGKRVANNLPRIALVSGLKLILLPFFYIVTARLSGFSGFVPRVAFIEMIMPVAVLNFIIAKEFDFDSDLVSQCIVFSTLAFFPLLYIYDWAMKLFL